MPKFGEPSHSFPRALFGQKRIPELLDFYDLSPVRVAQAWVLVALFPNGWLVSSLQRFHSIVKTFHGHLSPLQTAAVQRVLGPTPIGVHMFDKVAGRINQVPEQTAGEGGSSIAHGL